MQFYIAFGDNYFIELFDYLTYGYISCIKNISKLPNFGMFLVYDRELLKRCYDI